VGTSLIPLQPAPQDAYWHMKGQRTPLAVGFIMACVVTAIFVGFSMTKITLVVALGIPLAALLFLSFEMTMLTFICLLFSVQDAGVVKIVVPFAAVVAMSFSFTHTRVAIKDFRSPILTPLLLYVACMMPSLFNSPDLLRTLPYLQNTAALVIVVLTLGASVSSHAECRKFIAAFFVLSFLNALLVIFLALGSGVREYGIPGLVFVDFVVVAVLLALNHVLFHKSGARLLGIGATGVIFLSLLFTQTRNTLISFALTLAIYSLYLIKNNHLLGYPRKRLLAGMTVLVVGLACVVGATLLLFPQAFERIFALGKSSAYEMQSADDFALNSIVTRILVWMTAWNGFLAHPIIGVGAFSFPFASKLYFDIPPALYRMFVEGMGPHITYLASLVETGIVGLVGFLVFLISSLRLALRAVRLSVTHEEQYLSSTLLLIQIYIAASMALTDAWLWSQCGMLWALILGVSVANFKLLAKRHA
jgi:O-antigen ligase